MAQVFVVGHDWGAAVAWWLCMLRPDKVKALVNLSVPFSPRNPHRRTLDSLRAIFGDDYYMCRFQVANLLCPARYLFDQMTIQDSVAINVGSTPLLIRLVVFT